MWLKGGGGGETQGDWNTFGGPVLSGTCFALTPYPPVLKEQTALSPPVEYICTVLYLKVIYYDGSW